MAPSNPYLVDEAVQRKLAEHDGKLIKCLSVRFPGGESEEHWDFHRPKEYELLNAFLGRFSDVDYREGKVTVEDAVVATYGTADEYLRNRIVKTHLRSDSAFNKAHMNGMVTMATEDGLIVRGDRVVVATRDFQEKADAGQRRLVKSAGTVAKSLNVQRRRSLRIAPSAAGELDAIANEMLNNVVDEQQRALGQGEG